VTVLTPTTPRAASPATSPVSPAVSGNGAPSWRSRNITLRSSAEIDAMRRSGAVVRAALEAARRACVAGATTAEVNDAAHAEIDAAGADALFLDYPQSARSTDRPKRDRATQGFPAATCVSVNEEVVHGVPGDRVLADGDLVTIDCGVRLDGWCADAAISVPVGEIAPGWRAMLRTAESLLDEAIRLALPGRRWSEIAKRLEEITVEAGLGIVEGYVGHGIGRQLHEAPEVACSVVGDRHIGRDFTLRPGMTLAVEPILALSPGPDGRTTATRVCDDGWTVVTSSGVPACHVEQTIAITRSETVILTA